MDKKQILIVDNDKDVLSVLKKALDVEGYSVITARNGIGALKLVNSKIPDLIILDLVMPNMGGEEVAEKLRKSPETKDIPVIFLTALISRREEESGHLVGGNVIFAKPFDTEALLIQIKDLLQKKNCLIKNC